MFGDDRLADSLKSVAGLDSLSVIENDIRDVYVFSKGVDQSDDITTLALRYVGQRRARGERKTYLFTAASKASNSACSVVIVAGCSWIALTSTGMRPT